MSFSRLRIFLAPALGALMIAVALAVATPYAGVAQERTVQLRPIPSPSMENLSPDLARRVQEAQARVEGLKDRPGPLLADAYGELGKLYLHYGFAAAAEPALDNADALEDETTAGRSPWRYYLAVAQEQKGDLARAARTLRRVLAHREGNLPAVLRLAGVLVELGENQEAQKLYEAALQSPLGKAAGHAGLGRLALESGDAPEAIAHLRAAMEVQPEATALGYRLGLAYRDAGRFDEARELLAEPGGREVQFPDPLMIQLRMQMEGIGNPSVAGGLAARRGDLEKAIPAYREALGKNPDDLQSRRSLAAALFESGDLQGAEKAYREILRRDPENASAHLELGTVVMTRTGRAAAGLGHLEKAVETAPEFREARLRLARSLAAAGRLEEAVPHLQKAVELDPRDAEGRLRLARALLELRRTEEAAKEAATLLAQEPDNPDAVILRGRIHAINGNPGAAEREFTRITELSSADRDRRARAWFNMALLRQAQGRPGESVGFYQKALELDPRHRQSLFNLAVIQASSGRLQEAAVLYQKLLDLDPSQDDVRYRLAVTFMSGGVLEPASEHFETLIRARPGTLDFLIPGSLLLAELGRAREAADRLEEALARTREPEAQARLQSTLGAVELKNGRRERGLGYLRDAAQQAPKVPEVRKRYAEALAGEKRYAQAAEEYAAYLELAPADNQAIFARATTLILLDRRQEAVELLTDATRNTSNVTLTHLLARLLASAPEAEVRNGERAVQIAQAVFEAERNPAHGETLAMAMAAAGRFDEALALQKRLLQEAEAANFDAGFIARVRRNLERYEQGRPGVSDW